MGNTYKMQTAGQTAASGLEKAGAQPISPSVPLSGRYGHAMSAKSPMAEMRHSALVRITHWITTLSFLALLVTGVEILISHPRFYWGETGNVHTPPLFTLRIPASRATVPTGYGYVLADQNGWSRYLHFEAAWVAVLTGLLYVGFGVFQGHFRHSNPTGGRASTWPMPCTPKLSSPTA